MLANATLLERYDLSCAGKEHVGQSGAYTNPYVEVMDREIEERLRHVIPLLNSGASQQAHTEAAATLRELGDIREQIEYLRPIELEEQARAAELQKQRLAKVDVSCLRFDLQGCVVTGDVPWTQGLHHHGADASLAGYTLGELCHLCRSTLGSQRVTALAVLAGILSGADARPARLNTLIMDCLDSMGFPLIVRLAIDEDQKNTECAAALACLLALIRDARYNGPHPQLPREHSSLDVYRGMEWVVSDPLSDVDGGNPQGDGDEDENGVPLTEADKHLKVAGRDIVRGLLVMDVLPRLRYVVAHQVDNPASRKLGLQILFHMVARGGEDVALQVFQAPNMLDALRSVLLEHVAESLGLQAARVVRILCQASRAAALAMDEAGLVSHLLIVVQDTFLESEVAIEALRAWRACLCYGVGVHHIHNAGHRMVFMSLGGHNEHRKRLAFLILEQLCVFASSARAQEQGETQYTVGWSEVAKSSEEALAVVRRVASSADVDQAAQLAGPLHFLATYLETASSQSEFTGTHFPLRQGPLQLFVVEQWEKSPVLAHLLGAASDIAGAPVWFADALLAFVRWLHALLKLQAADQRLSLACGMLARLRDLVGAVLCSGDEEVPQVDRVRRLLVWEVLEVHLMVPGAASEVWPLDTAVRLLGQCSCGEEFLVDRLLDGFVFANGAFPGAAQLYRIDLSVWKRDAVERSELLYTRDLDKLSTLAIGAYAVPWKHHWVVGCFNSKSAQIAHSVLDDLFAFLRLLCCERGLVPMSLAVRALMEAVASRGVAVLGSEDNVGRRENIDAILDWAVSSEPQFAVDGSELAAYFGHFETFLNAFLEMFVSDSMGDVLVSRMVLLLLRACVPSAHRLVVWRCLKECPSIVTAPLPLDLQEFVSSDGKDSASDQSSHALIKLYEKLIFPAGASLTPEVQPDLYSIALAHCIAHTESLAPRAKQSKLVELNELAGQGSEAAAKVLETLSDSSS